MHRWATMTRAMIGAAAFALAAVGAAQDAAIPRGDGYAELETLPDFTGVWNPDWSLLFASGGGRAPVEPKLTPAAQEKLDAFRAKQAAEGVSQDAQVRCLPPGMPGIMRQPYPLEFLFTPGRVTINQEAWMQTRTIWTDGRNHLEEPDPTFMGNSIGRWEGDTLVVETLGISDELELDTGMPHSAQFRLTERLHLSPDNPDVLVNEMRMEDSEALEEPFEITVRYRRDRHGSLIEFQCAENDRNPIDEEGNTQFL